MIYVMFGLALVATAILCESKRRLIVGAVGALIAIAFSLVAICSATEGNFDMASSHYERDIAVYKGNDTYECREWGTVKTKVENPNQFKEGETVYLFKYSNPSHSIDLLVAPWRLYRPRWYVR